MRVQESFEVGESRQRVWEFFNQPEQVAACVPGVESVEPIDDDHLRVQLTQSVGPMSATFALKMEITERVEGQAITFTAIGRVVRGASGSVRSSNRVQLESVGEDRTRVNVDADVAMGGMLGSVGQKVIGKQAQTVTRDFAETLQGVLRGGPLPTERPVAEPSEASAATPPAGAPAGPGGGISVDLTDWRVISVGVAVLMLIAWLAGRSSGSNAAYAQLAKKGQVR